MRTTSTSTSASRYSKKRKTNSGKTRYYAPQTPYGRARTEVKCRDLNIDFDTPGTLVGVASVAGRPADNLFDTGMVLLNPVSTGTKFTERIGTKINIKSISLQGSFKQLTDATNVAYARYLIIYDRQPNGAFPAIGDILQTNDTNLAFNSGINMVNKSRFKIIRDKRITVDSGSGLQFAVKEYCKGNWETEYGTSTNLIGDVRTGAILFVAFQASAGTGGGAALIPTEFQSRVRYWDT